MELTATSTGAVVDSGVGVGVGVGTDAESVIDTALVAVPPFPPVTTTLSVTVLPSLTGVKANSLGLFVTGATRRFGELLVTTSVGAPGPMMKLLSASSASTAKFAGDVPTSVKLVP